MTSSNPTNSPATSAPSEAVMVLMQTVYEVMQVEQKQTARHIVVSILEIIAFIGLTIGGIVFCELKYFYGAFNFTTVMFFNILIVSISYFATMHFFYVLDTAKEKYHDIMDATTKGVTITSAMEEDFEAGRRVIVKITPKLHITIDSFAEEELEAENYD